MKSITKSKSFKIQKDECAECGKTRWLYDELFCCACRYKMILNDPCCLCKKFKIKKSEYFEVTTCFDCYLKTKTK